MWRALNEISNSPLAAWLMCVASFGAALSGIYAYFHDEVPNLAAWPSILGNGLVTIIAFAVAHSSIGVTYAGPDGALYGQTQQDFATTLYFSVVTFTTLGYGDLHPSPALRSLAATEALIGYVYLGLLVGVGMHGVTRR